MGRKGQAMPEIMIKIFNSVDSRDNEDRHWQLAAVLAMWPDCPSVLWRHSSLRKRRLKVECGGVLVFQFHQDQEWVPRGMDVGGERRREAWTAGQPLPAAPSRGGMRRAMFSNLVVQMGEFVKFANIEEDTPSYHRSYDFFVSRFSEMCHSSHDDLEIKTKIRMSGIKGLQGVVRKTVNDELQANIWDPQHMDKIVPSLLFNLQHVEEAESRSPSPLQAPEKEKESPAELAERCLRELLGRAAFGNIKNAIKPVLM
ncbi:Protein EFR3-like protein B [Plecturocebus cupreus]